MSYPFQSGQHPYPPDLSYPSAPPMQSRPICPPYPNQGPYPPNPSGYPMQGSSYPSAYPSLPTPYPNNAFVPSPHPSNPTSSIPYPLGPPSSVPYPSIPTSSVPYPPNPSSSVHYPPNPSSSVHYPPNPSSSVHYPPNPSSVSYPSLATPNIPHYPSSSATYPQNPAASVHYPPSSAYPSPYPSHSSAITTSSVGGSYSSHHNPVIPKRNPTVRPSPSFNPRSDAEILRKAMKGFGTDEVALISVLGHRTNQERQEIAREFKTLYGKDLIKDLKGETSGKFEQLLVALMTPLPQFYAEEIHHALSGIGTNESTLIEVLCTLSNSEINFVKYEYEKLYKESLEQDLRSDTSGNFKRLLTSLCTGRRDENPNISAAAAENDAQSLLRAGELRFGTDESVFNAILCSRSFPHLQAVFDAYQRLTGHPLEKAIKKEFSGDIEQGLLAIVQCVRNRALYLAERLYDSMAGAGTNDRALIRLVVTRCEIDLEDVKQQFCSKYGKTVDSFIKGDTSGDYKKLLLALCGY